MELWQEILCTTLAETKMEITFPQIPDVEKLFSNACYLALLQIKTIVEDTRKNDADCFEAIEEVVSVLESLGSDGGARHDFG